MAKPTHILKNVRIWLAAAGLTLVVGALLIVGSHHSKVPHQIIKQADFGVYFPGHEPKGFSVDRSTLKAGTQENGDKLVSYTVRHSGNKIVVSEQKYPAALIFDKLTASFLGRREVGTQFGNATVGKPHDQPNVEAAVLKVNDTLVFAKPDQPLTDQEWRDLINSLDIAR